MAVNSATAVTSTAVGNREDLSDTTVRIYADEMPLQNLAGTATAKAVDHDWVTTEIRQGVLTNAQPEGATARSSAAKVRARLRNKAQIFDEYISVSGTQEAVNKAAIRSEYKEQKKLKTKEMLLDKEATYCSAQEFSEQTGTGAGQGRKMSGIQCFITEAQNTSRGTGGADGAINANGYATAPTAGTNRAFVEEHLNSVMLGMYLNGAGGNKTALMGATLKNAAAGFAGTVPLRNNIDSDSITVIATIDYYDSGYGVMALRAHQSQLVNECIVIKDDIVDIAKLRGLQTSPLSKVGDSKEAQMVCEDTLVVKNTKGLGGAFDLIAA